MEATRREFLRSAAAAGAAAHLAGTTAPSPRPDIPSPIPRRVLGKTKIPITMLGLGCAYAGGGVSQEQTCAILEAALEGGVRYFDAAPEYTSAEERLGPVISGIRDECFLVTKTYAFDAETAEKDLRGSLERLDTDHVDLFLQHGVGLKPMSSADEILAKDGSLEYLRKAKEEGLTRFIGMSVHSPHAVALRLMDDFDGWDVIMPFINYVDRAQVMAETGRCELIPRAQRENIGVVGMKVLGGNPGLFTDDYDRAFRYALSVAGVSGIVIGARNLRDVNRALEAVKEFHPMSETEMQETLRKGEQLVQEHSAKSLTLYRHRRADYRYG